MALGGGPRIACVLESEIAKRTGNWGGAGALVTEKSSFTRGEVVGS